MTLTAEESSNKKWLESESTENIITIIRTAMGEGCIHPCHVYDAVDEALCRLQKLDNGQRNCDVFRTRKEADMAFERYTKYYMVKHLLENDYSSSALDYEDWLLAEYNPVFYQPYKELTKKKDKR